ncbi:uncharacterized protein B0P05DRAFT_542940 [Gilbertella persicaria]|uniref:uncharacterized protein n=1 Tax=Gilbertella persicaria TaxID=101096 RepID=UPI0022203E3D|nr:uncharacterized protein B0P05DRAFT_542940 [Gilbertella persicaria]KAI8078209.1 hypothetical protein B0P05DRAFT_542940 [Gilbertella persicaria]
MDLFFFFLFLSLYFIMYTIPFFFFYLFTYAACSPVLSRFFNSIGCTRSIHQDLDPMQAFNPNLNNSMMFGYIYSMKSSGVDIDSDIEIKNIATEWLPLNAMALLTSISFDEPTARLVVSGRISALNRDKLAMAARDMTSVNLHFGTFAFDKSKHSWYSSFKHGNKGISGTLQKLQLIQQFGRGSHHQEFLMEITPSQKGEYFKYRASDQGHQDIRWDGKYKNKCSMGLVFNNRGKDYLDELVESTILL